MTLMDLLVKSLRPELLDDYLDFFDHRAFADNPDWGDCYCYFYLADPAKEDWFSRTGEQNRRSVSELIARGEMYGYLAYVEGKVAGWCHAGPKTNFSGLLAGQDLVDSDTPKTGSIVCFVVAAAYRRRGIATALLEAACQGFVGLGLRFAEAYPSLHAAGDGANYNGPLRMYLEAGFAIHRKFPTYQVVRKAL